MWIVQVHFEEMVMTTALTGEHVQTMGRQAVIVVLPEVTRIAGVIAIASWWEAAVAV